MPENARNKLNTIALASSSLAHSVAPYDQRPREVMWEA
jgi:hypothetical protein